MKKFAAGLIVLLTVAYQASACSETIEPPKSITGLWIIETPAHIFVAYDGFALLRDDCTFTIGRSDLPERDAPSTVHGEWSYLISGASNHLHLYFDYVSHMAVPLKESLCFLLFPWETGALGYCHATWVRPEAALEYAARAGKEHIAEKVRNVVAMWGDE